MSIKKHSINNSSATYSLIAITVALLFLISVVVMVFITHFANEQFRRDEHNWELRLNTIADIRAGAVKNWVGNQYNELESVANNMSLRLYLTEIRSDSREKKPASMRLMDTSSAQISFMRNYISLTAERAGFSSRNENKQVAANISPVQETGIAIVDVDSNIIASTGGIVSPESSVYKFIKQAEKGKRTLLDMFAVNKGEGVATPQIAMAFLVPVYAVQGDPVPEQQIGWVLGVKYVDELYSLLNFPDEIEKTAESLLVRSGNMAVEYLSPLDDGTLPLTRQLKLSGGLASSFALENPGRFATKKDYSFNKVLMTSRAIENTPWILLHKVQIAEALGDSARRRVSLIIMGVLSIFLLYIVIYAIWRHGVSVRYRRLAEQFKSQEALLRLVTDNQPDSMFIFDHGRVLRFVNKQAAAEQDISSEEMIGKKLKHIFGAERADEIGKEGRKALTEDRRLVRIGRNEDEARILQTNYIPLQHVPDILTDSISSGVLITEQDITEAITEREKNERLLKRLVDKLVFAIDKRDSYAAHHSCRVALLAEALAVEMKLETVLVDTVSVAGKLMNLGKILLPPDILTKKDKLTKKERDLIKSSLQTSADFLSGLEFDGPVEDTLRQSQEFWDGSGSMNLQGDDILVTAQIISLSNTYIAMISPRSYRPGIAKDEVLDELLKESGKKYQRRVIAALVNLIENHVGPASWETAVE